MVVCDAVLRKLPGALGDETSAIEESFSLSSGPERRSPLHPPGGVSGVAGSRGALSGHHARIRAWRLAQSRARAAAEEGG